MIAMNATLTALLAMLLLAVAPVAPARCPCPAAPAAAKVCGSDYTTYDSQCHLECAAVPGLTAAHPGPCSATEKFLRPLSPSATRLSGFPADDHARIRERIIRRACASKTRSECRAGGLCDDKCKLNCICGCYGRPGSTLDNAHAVYKCVQDCEYHYKAFSNASSSNVDRRSRYSRLLTRDVIITGSVTIPGGLTIPGDETFGNVIISGSVTVAGRVRVPGGLRITDAMRITGGVTITGGVIINGGA